MGIDATAVCTTLPKGLLFRMSGPKVLHAIPKIAADWATAKGLGPLFQTAMQPDGTLQVQLVPVTEPLLFTAPTDRMTASFRSSGIGPGYHRVVVELLDHLATKLQFTWSWTATDGAPLDETGYGQTRDTTALEAAMLEFLRGLGQVAQTTISHDRLSALAFCIPMGLGQEDGKIACPMGSQPQHWAADLAGMNDAALRGAAKGFFPWWEAELGAATLETLLRAILWQNAEWRPPIAAPDHLTRSQIGYLQQRLKASGHALPADIQAALQEYEACQVTATPPASRGIGYRKRLIHEQIFKSWSIKRPGFACPVDNGDSAAWEHPAFWLGASSLVSDAVETGPEPMNWPDVCAGPTQTLRSGVQYRISGRERLETGGGRQRAILVSRRASETQFLILTLSSHLDWPYEAFETWVTSVTCPDLPAPIPPLAPLH